MKMRDIMARAPVIPVLTIEREADAVPLARALCAGGLMVLEVTLRTPAALPAIAAMRRALPDAIIGAGTLTQPADFERVKGDKKHEVGNYRFVTFATDGHVQLTRLPKTEETQTMVVNALRTTLELLSR